MYHKLYNWKFILDLFCIKLIIRLNRIKKIEYLDYTKESYRRLSYSILRYKFMILQMYLIYIKIL